MGRDRRHGFPYTWLPNHLGDAAGQGRHLAGDLLDICDPTVEALLVEHIQLDLGHVQPATVLRGEDKLEPIP